MWIMKSKRKKPAERDAFIQGEIPFLWPDENGSLSLDRPNFAGSSELRPRKGPRSPRKEVVRAARFLQTDFLSTWLMSKSRGAVGFGKVKESIFETWLSQRLEKAAFNALELVQVVRDAVEDLELGLEEVIGLLIRLTRVGAKFKSDGELIT